MKFHLTQTSLDLECSEIIEIDTLEELLKFINENGQIVFGECYYPEFIKKEIIEKHGFVPKYEIEIYDTWRE